MQEAAGARLRSALEDDGVPKAVHDYKAAIHAFEPQGITLRGVRHDPMLYSYLLDPTYSSHRLAEVATKSERWPSCRRATCCWAKSPARWPRRCSSSPACSRHCPATSPTGSRPCSTSAAAHPSPKPKPNRARSAEPEAEAASPRPRPSPRPKPKPEARPRPRPSRGRTETETTEETETPAAETAADTEES